MKWYRRTLIAGFVTFVVGAGISYRYVHADFYSQARGLGMIMLGIGVCLFMFGFLCESVVDGRGVHGAMTIRRILEHFDWLKPLESASEDNPTQDEPTKCRPIE